MKTIKLFILLFIFSCTNKNGVNLTENSDNIPKISIRDSTHVIRLNDSNTVAMVDMVSLNSGVALNDSSIFIYDSSINADTLNYIVYNFRVFTGGTSGICGGAIGFNALPYHQKLFSNPSICSNAINYSIDSLNSGKLYYKIDNIAGILDAGDKLILKDSLLTYEYFNAHDTIRTKYISTVSIEYEKNYVRSDIKLIN